MTEPFDPLFDDCRWTEDWMTLPIIQLVPGVYETFTVKCWDMAQADICDRRVNLSPPLDVRGLIMSDGALWMSDVPQERLMMWNNAQVSRGWVLVGGLGVGLYPQYALPRVEGMVIIERDAPLCRVVGPVAQVAADAAGVPLELVCDDVVNVLRRAPDRLYDTIFLDTWDTLDAINLPHINALRDMAARHLAPGGQVLLWGYAWMLRLFEAACEQLLAVAPGERLNWLQQADSARPGVGALLQPVAAHFAGQVVTDLPEALAWCRAYIVDLSEDL